MNGVHRYARAITNPDGGAPSKADKAFEIWWGLSIKFFIPAALLWMLMMSIKFMGDIGVSNYEKGDMKWQYVGMIFPIIGLIVSAIPAFVRVTPVES